jgi:hypothetical protein
LGTLAKAPAKDRLTIFKGKVPNEFLAFGAIYEQLTPSLFLLTQVTSMKWGMLNPDALESGLLGNAFLFTDLDVEVAQASIGKLTSSNRGVLPLRMQMHRYSSRPRLTYRDQTTPSDASSVCWRSTAQFFPGAIRLSVSSSSIMGS